MARMPRIVIPGQPLHVIQRGNNRADVFFQRSDYLRYLNDLREAAERYGCAIHAYVLMTNHVHLLLTPDHEQGPAHMMQAVGRRYVRYVNTRHGRTGTLWEGRYKSVVVDSENYLLACSRYIELNPVRAGMVTHPGEYSWSSYGCNARGVADNLITPHPVYRALGPSAAEREAAYGALFGGLLESRTLKEIRDATHAGMVLGGKRFRKEVEAALGRPVARRAHGGDRRSKEFRQRKTT
ncbi:transposase [Thioalkalivibrio denitrificans]|uniref:Transposase n=1 Tax=Thioalkalivibrio denitrificans TaxID=108003 RepID=A0A1V3NIV4_9GAMM|nr:transposase [Thioalkalivibrio denitrificans]OOG24914.1 transposase [Thioalkalivibrio denitrificans]